MAGRLLLSGLIALAVPPAAQVAPAGRWEFTSTSMRGDPLTGTIYLTTLPGGGTWGRIFTTIDAPNTVTRAAREGDRLVVAALLDGGLEIEFAFHPEGDSLAGAWRVGDRSTPATARHVEGPAPLPPIPCRARGLRETVRCAVYLVPENRASGEGPTIPLTIVILPADSARRGALFHFAGGPGQAASEFADGNAQRFAAVRRHRDIVMLDQRGTGGSNGLPCDFPSPQARAALLLGNTFPPDDVRGCRDTLTHRADLRQYHTAVAADDVADVARWLGYERIDLYGGSYGTRAALAVMRQHPGLVRTATLRAVIAPDGSLPRDNPAGAQASLDRVFAACAAEAPCRSAFPDLGGDFRALLDRLDTSPPVVTVRDPVSGDSVALSLDRGVVGGALRRMLMDGALIPSVPFTIHAAARGDFEVFRRGIERTLGVAGSLYWGMGLSVVCAEDPPIIRARGLPDADASFLGNGQARSLLEICDAWPRGAPPPGYDQPVTVTIPTLVLSGEFDPATPPEWGAAVARQLPNSVHLIMTGVSHAPFPACAQAIMTAVVERGSVADVDTSCVGALARAPFQTGG
ncbi:MAG TPA: alpha/beta hydrolase [Gemmatimonadales bacterium]|nr:alpha/beta hydrolase [Gemmatimonadales bacterium]